MPDYQTLIARLEALIALWRERDDWQWDAAADEVTAEVLRPTLRDAAHALSGPPASAGTDK